MLVFYYYARIWEKTNRESYVSEKLLSGCSVYPPLDNSVKRPKNKKSLKNNQKRMEFA
jgi:hypothetical protein